MIPFQLHRRIPLIRRPFWQRDLARQEAQELRDRAAEHNALVASLKTQMAELEDKFRASIPNARTVPQDLDAGELDRIPDAESFYEFIVRYAITCIRENDFADNFDDSIRLHEPLLFPRPSTWNWSPTFCAQRLAFYFVWLGRSYGQLFEAFRTLEDLQSRLLFASLLIYRLVGHHGFQIPVPFRDRRTDLASYRKIEEAGRTNSGHTVEGLWGRLSHYDFVFDGKRYIVDCLGLEYYLFRGQYSYRRNGITVAPLPGDYVVDGGSWVGDASCVFSNAVGPEGKVFAFDPLDVHIEVLRHNARHFVHRNVTIMPFGLADDNFASGACVAGSYDPGFSVRGKSAPLRTLDNCVESGEIDRVGFVKLDIEGSELDAIRGAAGVIEKFRPRLAISLYHFPDHLFSIILHLKQRYPFYRMFLDHYTVHLDESVLYCLPS
jgi:FkbM family methyltransferase